MQEGSCDCMIFVTTGTIGSDDIIKKVDEIAPGLKDSVIMTLGRGKYIPKNCKWFKYTSSISSYFKRASLIITHGGAGTLFECLSLNKRIIAIPQDQTGDQKDLVDKLSEEGYILKCENLGELEGLVNSNKRLVKYNTPKLEIADKIEMFLLK